MTPERRVYRSALRGVLVSSLVVAVVGVGLSWAFGGRPEALAAGAGAGIAALAGVASPASMLAVEGRGPGAIAPVVGGVWVGKMAIILVAFAAFSGSEDFPRAPFALTLLAGVIASLFVDFWAVRRGRVPYVSPDSKSRA